MAGSEGVGAIEGGCQGQQAQKLVQDVLEGEIGRRGLDTAGGPWVSLEWTTKLVESARVAGPFAAAQWGSLVELP